MGIGVKTIVNRVVNMVAPPPEPMTPLRPGPRNEPPILDHRPGIDRTIYGPDETRSNEHIASVNGKTYKLFFLCGHQRSGTHWMDSLLSRHPAIQITGEFRFESLRNATDDLIGSPWHACYRDPMKAVAEQCFRESVRRILGASSETRPWAEWIGDRTPRALQVYLPGASHFLIIRDPRDILVSWSHMEFRNAGFHYTSGGFGPRFDLHRGHFLKDPDYFNKNPHALLGDETWVKRLAEAWRTHTRTDLAALKALQDGTTDARAMVLRYEQVHQDPEGQRAAMYRFLGVDPGAADPLSEDTRSKPGFSKENPHGIYRKGETGEWRRYFTPEVALWFKEQAGDTLIELGYEKDHNW